MRTHAVSSSTSKHDKNRNGLSNATNDQLIQCIDHIDLRGVLVILSDP